MRIFEVGGCVRDQLMDVDPKDFDFVVVGSTPEEMVAKGFVQVGQGFPVFLKDGCEYALARSEKKVGSGYVGFEFEWEGVTIEDDLFRRDLTINSMAVEWADNEMGTLIDPYNGHQDIINKVLRHTSDAFAEDPVRVLRLARFRARFGPEWEVARETQLLVAKMAKDGVLSELQPDRVWKEFSRAMMEPHPRLFFDTLLHCDALHKTFPLVYRLLRATEAIRHHPEGNSYEHTMLVLTAARKMNASLEEMFACLCHDLGKGLTPFKMLPAHHGHEKTGVPLVDEMAKVMSVPAAFVKSARLATRYHMNMHSFEKIKPTTMVKMFDVLGATQQNSHASVLRMVACADYRGRLGCEDADLSFLQMFDDMLEAYRGVKFKDVFPAGPGELLGEQIQEKIYVARVSAVRQVQRKSKK